MTVTDDFSNPFASGDDDATTEPAAESVVDTDVAAEADVEVAPGEVELPGDAEILEVSEILDDEDLEPEPSPYDRPGRWYVVHTYAGYENKVKQNLASRVRSMNVEERIFEVVIPMEDVIEFKNGRKVVVQKKVWPGYLLIRMALDDDSWYVVRNTPGVTGFVGSGAKPTPLTRREVEVAPRALLARDADQRELVATRVQQRHGAGEAVHHVLVLRRDPAVRFLAPVDGLRLAQGIEVVDMTQAVRLRIAHQVDVDGRGR